MNNVSTIMPDDDDAEKQLSEYQLLSTERLRQLMNEAIGLSVQMLTKAALILRVLEERGETLPEDRSGFRDYLRKIAYGQVLPEVILKYLDKPGGSTLTRLVSNLPKPDQKRIVEGKPVEVVVRRADGSFDKRMADPAEMQPSQLKQVFGHGSIRSEAEQILLLESKGDPIPDRPGPSKVGPILPDPKRGGLRIGRAFVPVAEVLEALAKLHPGLPPDADDEKVSVTLKLSPIELKRLKLAATRAGVSPQILIYRAVMVVGLLAENE